MALALDSPPAAMTWWKSPPSSSSVSPKSGADSPSKGRRAAGLRDIGLFRSRREQPQPRLGRQRRLRRPGDLVVEPAAGFRGEGAAGAGARSPAGAGEAESSPLPLPVPDLASLLRWEGRGRLLSPREVAGTDNGDGKEKSNGSSSGSNFTSPLTRKRPEHVNESSSASASVNDLKTLLERKTAEEVEGYRINLPASSAPNSKLSSPVQSPRRMSTGDFVSSSSAASQVIRFWSSPEIPVSDVTATAFHSHASPDKLSGLDQDWSPLHSPTWNSVISKSGNPSGETTQVNSNRSLESSSWHDQGLVAVHPLPLPPGAPLPSLSTFLPHSSPVLEVPPMKCQWQKGKLIGRGTFGNVYVATNKETGALCAMKEVNLIPDDPKSVESMMQLEQEIKVLSQLKHPNIVQYYGSEIVEDQFYIYLEYVHPGSISKYVREHCGAMTESVVRNFTRHILTGLAYLHSKKTIHRDIKGANLLVDAFGVVKLADFGMAKHLSGQAAALSLRGSPYWMAPEVMQAMMQKDAGYDLAVDIWSLGCTIIEMFTGKPPWNEYEGAAAMFKVLKNESPPIPANLSAEGKDFLQLCFRRNPSDRPSASVLLEHRFVRNVSQIQETSGYINELSRMQLMDLVVPSTEWNRSNQTGKGRPIPNW